MTERYGATPDEWDHLSLLLGLTEDLLPVVSDPTVPISPGSSLKATGKTPSIVSRAGAAGIAKWTQKRTTQAEIDRWRADGRLGICIATRRVRAFDIDIEDPDLAQEVANWIVDNVGPLPLRTRANSPKRLFAFQLAGELPKRVIKMKTGMVEFLATGQQFIACGTHPSGARYEWAGDLPDDILTLTLEQFESIWSGLATTFGVSQSESSVPTKAKVLQEAVGGDPTAQHLIEHGYVKQQTKEGALHIRCPFEAGHSTDSADSATTYWPAHTGGYAQGHFHCLHASCAHRSDDDFRAEIGMAVTSPFDGFFSLSDESAINAINGTSEATPSTTETSKKQRFRVVSAAEFSARKPLGWIIKGVLPKAELAVLYGDSGSGKTFFALDACGAIARGVDWRDHHVKQGKVAYICAEGAGGMRSRLSAYARHFGVDLAGFDLGIIPDAPNFMLVQDIKDLILSVQAFGPVSVIVVDTFAQVMPGANENAGEDVGKAIDHCHQLHKYTGALVLLVHHSGKDASKGARGWSGLRGALDAEIEIVRCDDDRVATVTKMKDGPDGAEFGFKLVSVPLGFDEDGDEITSCVLDFAEVKPREERRSHGKTGSNEKLVLQCLNGLMEVGDDGVAYQDLLNAVVAQMVPPAEGKRDRRSQLVSQAVDSLREKGSVTIENGFVKLPKTEGEE